jgi:hypothetical protein
LAPLAAFETFAEAENAGFHFIHGDDFTIENGRA